MSTQTIVPTFQQADFDVGLIHSDHDQNAIKLLREAANIGIADIEAGRFVTFDSDDEIDQHLAALLADAGNA